MCTSSAALSFFDLPAEGDARRRGAWRELASRLERSVPPAGSPFRTIEERPLMRIALTLLLPALSGVLLFWRLDGTLLWRDECSTANWARLMVESGYWLPRVFDGNQLIVQAPDAHDFNSQMLPAMQSWLQFYVAALAFKLLGVSTWAARLPFAILGAVCVFVFYRLGVVLFGTGLRRLLLPYLGLFSIYFLAAARQSRYYVLVVLAASLLLLEFCRYLRNPELAARRSFYLRICSAGLLLYFSNYVSFVTMWASLGVFVLAMRDPRLTRGFSLLTAVMAVPLAAEFWLFHAEFAASQMSSAPASLGLGGLPPYPDRSGEGFLENDSSGTHCPGRVLSVQAKGSATGIRGEAWHDSVDYRSFVDRLRLRASRYAWG